MLKSNSLLKFNKITVIEIAEENISSIIHEMLSHKPDKYVFYIDHDNHDHSFLNIVIVLDDNVSNNTFDLETLKKINNLANEFERNEYISIVRLYGTKIKDGFPVSVDIYKEDIRNLREITISINSVHDIVVDWDDEDEVVIDE